MLATRLTCPFCSKQLSFKQAPAAGRRVLCSGCDRSFIPMTRTMPGASSSAVPESSISPAGQISQRPAPLPSSILTPKPGAASPAPLLSQKALLAIIAAGLFLVGSGTAAGILLIARKDARQSAGTTENSITDREAKAGSHGSPSADAPGGSESPRPSAADDPGKPPAADERPRPPTGGRPPDLRPRTEPISVPAEERAWLPREVQLEVNKAIDRGAAFLKKMQKGNGTWEPHHTIAYSALPALTLLECGVPAKDPLIQKAAKWVREHYRKVTSGKVTYELSLALLFLDRLGEKEDRAIIRSIAMRLVAGQTAGGGWSYYLPELQPDEEDKLLQFLEQTRPQGLERSIQMADGQRVDPTQMVRQGQGSGDQGYTTTPGGRQGPSVVQPDGVPLHPGDRAGGSKKPERKKPLSEAEAGKARKDLPARVRDVPAVVEATRKPGKKVRTQASDNSNTQFATLALWAASRHGLPLERSLDLLAKRFRDTQGDDGRWGYHPNKRAVGMPSMTGAGLLGLAVGHGLHTGKKVKDDQVEKGMRAIAKEVGKPLGADAKRRLLKGGRKGRVLAGVNLYFLWTLERVGVLYDARKMDGKDWYLWGVEQLLDAQKPAGFWQEGGYHGSCQTLDTCLALLFLKRANFATDLTKKLEFVIDGKSALRTTSTAGR